MKVGAAVIALAVVGCAGCSVATMGTSTVAPTNLSATPSAPSDPAATPVAVTRGPIESIVVVDGTAAIDAAIPVAAPRAGTYRVLVPVGAHVIPGQRVATGPVPVVAPAAGTVTGVRPGPAEQNMPVLTLAYAGYAVPVSVTADLLFRVYHIGGEAKFAVRGGPAGGTCAVVAAQGAAAAPVVAGAPSVTQGSPPQGGGGVSVPGVSAGESGSGAAVLCLLPLGTRAYPGASVQVGLRTGRVDNVLRVPVTSVLGTTQHGRVLVRRGSAWAVRDVDLGLSDGTLVEVTSGLVEGDLVSSTAPEFP